MYRLLIVDDEHYEREGLKGQLKWEQYGFIDVDTANNGLDACRKFENAPYDVVIADIKMPIMDGLTMAKRMKEQCHQTQFLFLSGYDDFDFVQQAVQLQAKDYLLKPLDEEKLELRIREMILCLDDIRQREEYTKQHDLQWELLGNELFSHFRNGRWKQLFNMLDRLGYMQQPCLNWIYGKAMWSDNAHSLKNQLVLLLRNLHHGGLLGMDEGNLLCVFPDGDVIQYSSLQSILDFLCKTAHDREKQGATVQWISVKTDKSMQESIQLWKDAEIDEKKQISMLAEKLVEIIQTRYMSDLTLKQIAEEVMYSPNYLSMVFKRETGQNFNKYLTAHRMKEAKRMLLETNMKIYQISDAVGYQDTVAFIKQFRKEYGCAPFQYKNRFSGKQEDTE